MLTIAARIRQVRAKIGLNQKQFAAQLGMSAAHISKIEHGKDNPSDKLLKQISLTFDISLEWLKTGEGTPDGFEDELFRQSLNVNLSPNSPLFTEIVSLVSSAPCEERQYIWGILSTLKDVLSADVTGRQRAVIIRVLFDLLSITHSHLIENYIHGNPSNTSSLSHVDSVEELWRRSCGKNMQTLKDELLYKNPDK